MYVSCNSPKSRLHSTISGLQYNTLFCVFVAAKWYQFLPLCFIAVMACFTLSFTKGVALPPKKSSLLNFLHDDINALSVLIKSCSSSFSPLLIHYYSYHSNYFFLAMRNPSHASNKILFVDIGMEKGQKQDREYHLHPFLYFH